MTVKTFFMRELRRQAPVAVASVVLGLLVIVACLIATDSLLNRLEGAWLGFSVAVVAAAFLLGIASVAPDAESGAQVFLAILPMRRWKEVLVRLSVAALLTLVTGILAAMVPLYL